MLTNGTEVMIWNDENELVTNFVAGAWKSEFVYDGKMRRRIEKDYSWNGAGWTQTNELRFIYDGNVIVQHRDANNLPTLTLTRGKDLSGALQGAGGIGGLLAMTENSGTNSYYHADGNGNVTCLINTNQLLVAQAEVDPFGNFLSLSGPKAYVNCYWFSSKPIHWQSGKYDYLYRWYAPILQWWANCDPLSEQGFESIHRPQEPRSLNLQNLYNFVRNRPLNAIDALGLYTVNVKNCEVVVLFGHGSSSKPHTFTFQGTDSAGHFVGCENKATNDKIPAEYRIPGAPSTDEELYSGAQTESDPDHSFSKFFNDSWAAAKRKAADICKKGSCSSVTVRSELAGSAWNPDNWAFQGTQKETICCPKKKQ
jgi:RHS repeat-associated protein